MTTNDGLKISLSHTFRADNVCGAWWWCWEKRRCSWSATSWHWGNAQRLLEVLISEVFLLFQCYCAETCRPFVAWLPEGRIYHNIALCLYEWPDISIVGLTNEIMVFNFRFFWIYVVYFSHLQFCLSSPLILVFNIVLLSASLSIFLPLSPLGSSDDLYCKGFIVNTYKKL